MHITGKNVQISEFTILCRGKNAYIIINDYFSGLGSTIGSLCVFV